MNTVPVGFKPRIQLVFFILLNEGSIMPLIRRDSKGAYGEYMWQLVFVKQFFKGLPLLNWHERIFQGHERDSKTTTIDGSGDGVKESPSVLSLRSVCV